MRSVIWPISAHDLMILIFSTHEIAIEESVVQHNLVKLGPYFVKWKFKAHDCALNFHVFVVFGRCAGCSLKQFSRGKPQDPYFDWNPLLRVRSVYLDISKAFDRMWHDGLVYKLARCGVLGHLLSFRVFFRK